VPHHAQHPKRGSLAPLHAIRKSRRCIDTCHGLRVTRLRSWHDSLAYRSLKSSSLLRASASITNSVNIFSPMLGVLARGSGVSGAHFYIASFHISFHVRPRLIFDTHCWSPLPCLRAPQANSTPYLISFNLFQRQPHIAPRPCYPSSHMSPR